LRDAPRNSVGRNLSWWLPAAVLLAFAYVMGPDIYRRATGLQQTTVEGAPLQTPDDVLKLIGSLRSQLDTAKGTVERQNQELADVKRNLETARHPPPRSGPLATASLTLAMAKGTPREIAADNARWIAWDANARGGEMRWSTPIPDLSSFTIAPNKPSYPDLSGFSDGEYYFAKDGTKYKIFGMGTMTIIFLTFDKPVDTGLVQLSSDSTLPKWKYWCKDNSVCTVWFDERPDNLSFTIRVGR
jgi:hypothetical protein